MSTTTLTGHDALAHAARTGAQLHKHADPIDGARAVTLDEARAIAAEDAGLVWCAAPAIVPVRFTRTARHDGAEETLTVVRYDGDLVVQVTTDEDMVGLYDLDGDRINLRNGSEWEMVDAAEVPADVVEGIEGWDCGGDYDVVRVPDAA
jgi:hypothetical protein